MIIKSKRPDFDEQTQAYKGGGSIVKKLVIPTEPETFRGYLVEVLFSLPRVQTVLTSTGTTTRVAIPGQKQLRVVTREDQGSFTGYKDKTYIIDGEIYTLISVIAITRKVYDLTFETPEIAY